MHRGGETRTVASTARLRYVAVALSVVVVPFLEKQVFCARNRSSLQVKQKTIFVLVGRNATHVDTGELDVRHGIWREKHIGKRGTRRYFAPILPEKCYVVLTVLWTLFTAAIQRINCRQHLPLPTPFTCVFTKNDSLI